MGASTKGAGKSKRASARGRTLDRDRLVTDYLPLVRHVVSRIAVKLPPHVDTDELFQVGSVGLINASRGFDEHRGVAFKTYAYALIRGAILDELRRLDLVPRSTREKIRAMDACAAELAQELGRRPAPVEIAESLGTTEKAVERWIAAARMVAMLSLDDGSAGSDALFVRDILPCPNTLDPGDAAAKAELIEEVAASIAALPPPERRVITMYYREGLLLREIGAVMGVTESRISQIHSRAVRRLREMLGRR